MNTTPQYSITIEWSTEDQAYVVSLPEWADRYAMPVASGATYEEVAARGRNALEKYIRFTIEDGRPLPRTRVFASLGSPRGDRAWAAANQYRGQAAARGSRSNRDDRRDHAVTCGGSPTRAGAHPVSCVGEKAPDNI